MWLIRGHSNSQDNKNCTHTIFNQTHERLFRESITLEDTEYINIQNFITVMVSMIYLVVYELITGREDIPITTNNFQDYCLNEFRQ
ncbi:unnamed protein product [Adineta steineri]|uniref:Uncharacterized protein n=1 Tax=Adineta steineri TaxID=433720 RepID=A0A814RQS4_9BILA|nr:unnamed protein product [Adineta steineri]